jgi:D-3-phosphoglycerate dehydrogenase
MNSDKPKLLCMADLSVSPAAREILRDATKLDEMPPDQDALLETIPDYDAYFASLHVRFDKGVFERAHRLRLIATPSTGTDHIDLDEAARRGIRVLTLKEETDFLDSVTSTAELAWGLLLAAVRKIPSSFDDAKQGHWARDKFRGHQLSGKTLGILGYGRLGRIVADYGKAFRMRVIACDLKPFDEPGVERVDFDTLLAESDVLSIHIHLTDENRGLISREAFGKMKPGIVLINTSRGAIIDEAALLGALETGKVGAAGLDVIEGEWRADLINHPLIGYAREHDNLVITPHLGGVTFEAQDMTLQFIARKLVGALRQ